MKLTAALLSMAKATLRGPVQYLRAILAHPNATFHPGVQIGRGCEFGRDVTVFAGATLANAVVGDYSYVGGEGTLKNCTIGKYCSIAPNVRIGLGIHPTDRVSTYPGFFSGAASGATKFYRERGVVESLPVTVGNDVWIGTGAIIMDGVNVGHGAVIGAGAVVTTDVSPYAIVGGVPAKVIRNRFDHDMVAFFLKLRWWDWDEDKLRESARLFENPDVFRAAIENRE